MSEDFHNQTEQFKPSQEADNTGSLSSRLMSEQGDCKNPEHNPHAQNTADNVLPQLEFDYPQVESVYMKSAPSEAKNALDKSIEGILDKKDILRSSEDDERQTVKALMTDLAAKLAKLPPDQVKAGIEQLNQKLKDAGSRTQFRIIENKDGSRRLNMRSEGERGIGTEVTIPGDKSNTTTDSTAKDTAALEKAARAFDTKTPLSRNDRFDALKEVVGALSKIKELGGPEAVSKAVEKLNADLAKSKSLYSFDTSQSDGITLKEGDTRVAVRKFDEPLKGDKRDTSGLTKDNIEALEKAAKVFDKKTLSATEGFAALNGVAETLAKIKETGGQEALSKSIEKLNADLAKSQSPYRVGTFGKSESGQTDVITLRQGDKVVAARYLPKSGVDIVSDTAKAVQSGNPDSVQQSVKKLLESTKGKPQEFEKLAGQLADQLAKAGIEVKFNKNNPDSISLHKKDSAYGIQFTAKTDDSGESVIKMQPYDWESKQDTKEVKAQDVIKAFKTSETVERTEAKDVAKERTALEARAAKVFTRDQLQDFKDNLDKFEKYAKEHKLSAQEIAKTIRATRDLLESPNTHISEKDRAKLAFQVIRQAGDPSTVDQGDNKTCNATTVEKLLYSQEPSRIIQMMADIAKTGSFKTPDASEIKLDPEQLKPDTEAKRFNTKDGERSYATQIANLALINAHWQTQTKFNGKDVEKGSIRYEKIAGKGERLMDYSKEPPTALKDKEGNVIDNPKINVGYMSRMMEKFTGKKPNEMILVRTGNELDLNHNGIAFRGTQDSLQTTLEDIAAGKDGKKFPIIVTLLDSQQLTGDSDGEGGGHVVTITGIEHDREGKMIVHIDNQHGKAHDIKTSIDQLWKAMAPKAKK